MHKTILFLDGSKTSILLLNEVIKSKKFIIEFIIISPSCSKIISKKLKKNLRLNNKSADLYIIYLIGGM